MGKLRQREGKGSAQGHRSRLVQNWSPLSQAMPLHLIFSVQHQSFSCIWESVSQLPPTSDIPKARYSLSQHSLHKNMSTWSGFSQLYPHIQDSGSRARLRIWHPLSFWFWNYPIWFATSANKNLLDKMSSRLKLSWSNLCLGLGKPLCHLKFLVSQSPT